MRAMIFTVKAEIAETVLLKNGMGIVPGAMPSSIKAQALKTFGFP